MESFYGGRPGYAFILKGKYSNTTEMETALNTGRLKYGEYALITDDKRMSNEHGNIYRATSSKSESLNGFQLIGNMTAPAPLYPLEFSNNITGGKTISWEPVPGYKNENNVEFYNDTITGTYTYDTDTDGNRTAISLDFNFPYSVVDISLEKTTFSPTINEKEDAFDSSHPFYHHYNLSIPYGNTAIAEEENPPELSAGGVWLVLEDGDDSE